MTNKLSLIIPTFKDRSNYLKRSLYYYKAANFKGTIFIGDASVEEAFKNNTSIVEEYSWHLKIKHVRFPIDTGDHVIMYQFLQIVDTPYVVFSGDDDLQVVEELYKYVDFLEHNDEYIGAHGGKLKVTFVENAVQANLVPGQFFDIDDPLVRLFGYMATYTSPQYHVIRTNILKDVYSYMNDPKMEKKLPLLNAEMIPSCLYCLSGKIKRFPEISYVMEQSPVSEGIAVGSNTVFLDMMFSPEFADMARSTRDIIIEFLLSNKIIDSYDSAKYIVEELYCTRIFSHIHDQLRYKFPDFNKKAELYATIQNDHQSTLTQTDLVEFLNKILIYFNKNSV